MSDVKGLQFVTNINREGADKINFWVGDVRAFDRHNRALETKNLLFAGLLVVGVIVFRGAVSNYCLVDYRYSSLKEAQSQCNNAANDFQFLAEWLNLPLITESQIMYKDSNTPVYF